MARIPFAQLARNKSVPTRCGRPLGHFSDLSGFGSGPDLRRMSRAREEGATRRTKMHCYYVVLFQHSPDQRQTMFTGEVNA